MKNLLFFLTALVIITSCNNDEIDRDPYGLNDNRKTNISEDKSKINESEKQNQEKLSRYEAPVDTNIYRKDYFLEKTGKYAFSNDKNLDYFSVTIKGKKIYSATVEFTITNYNGEKIYTDKFPVLTVLENVFDGKGEYATFIQQDDYLQDWIQDFLTNEKFLYPAIHKEREFENEHSISDYWDEIQKDEKSIGFKYSKSKGSETEIAFNKVKGRVVKYYYY
ncbi:MAG: hypothetical protein WCI53_13250 [Bacteroidota bacterium]|jgi:hypothetical protein